MGQGIQCCLSIVAASELLASCHDDMPSSGVSTSRAIKGWEREVVEPTA